MPTLALGPYLVWLAGCFGLRTAVQSGRPLRTLPFLAGSLLLIGCGDDGSSSVAQSSDGQALYEQNCASCHGRDLRGTSKGPSHLSVVYEPGHHPDESFRVAVREGARQHHWDFGDMAPVEGLDDNELQAVIEFIRSKQEENGFEPYPPSPSPGP
jgi:mono/diheme cytochrome c family protein